MVEGIAEFKVAFGEIQLSNVCLLDEYEEKAEVKNIWADVWSYK
jgi:hypothetical protein